MKTRVSLLLWRKAAKADAQGVAPISCRVTVNARRAEIATSVRVSEAEWSDERKRVLGSSPTARTANAKLVKIIDQLTDLHADLERQGKRVRAAELTRLYRSAGCTLSLLELCGQFQEERRGLVGIEIKHNTVLIATANYNALGKFLAAHKLADLSPEEFTPSMADKLLVWAMKRGTKRNSANMVVQAVGQALRWAVRRELLSKSPLQDYGYKKTPAGEIVYLEAGEVAALEQADQLTPQQERARDCFLIQCYTGLAYADLKAMNIARDAKANPANGRRVLYLKRQKSTLHKTYQCVIPLLPEAERILAKHKDKPIPPDLSAYNLLLKELGALCGIDPAKMMSHTGRKTAGTLLLNKGIPLAVISQFLGHGNTLITQRLYAKLLDTTVVDAFDSVFGEPMPLPNPAASVDEVQGGRVLQLFRPARRIA